MRTAVEVVTGGLTLAAVAAAGALVVRGTPDASADADPGCTHDVRRTVEVAPAMADVARTAAAALRAECVQLTVQAVSSAQVARSFQFGKDVPALWIAESNTWQSQLFYQDVQLRVVGPALASSPVVLAGDESSTAPESWRAAFAADSVDLRDPLSDARHFDEHTGGVKIALLILGRRERQDHA